MTALIKSPQTLPRFGNMMPNDIIKRLIDIEQTLNTGFLPGTVTGTGNKFLQGSTSNVVTADTTLDSYSTGGSSWLLRAANGVMDTPAPSITGDFLGSYAFGGYGTSAFGFSRPGMFAFADEDWTNLTQGAHLSIFTTGLGRSNSMEMARFGNDSALSLGDIPNLYQPAISIAVNTTSGSPTITAYLGSYTFTPADVGKLITHPSSSIPVGTAILAVASDGSSATMVGNATSTASPVIMNLGANSGLTEAYPFRTSGAFIGHQHQQGQNTAPNPIDPYAGTALFFSLQHVLDDNTNSQASSLIPGPRGAVQFEGSITIGPHYSPADAAGGPLINNSLTYTAANVASDIAPGGFISGMVDSGVFHGASSGHDFSIYQNSTFWANKMYISSGGGTLHVGEVTDYITVNFIQRSTGGVLGAGVETTVGRWTGYLANGPNVSGHAALAPSRLYRAVGFEFGSTRSRYIGVQTTANSPVLTTATPQFSAADVGAAAGSIIATIWTVTTPFLVNDYCSSSGRIYKCLIANTGSAPSGTTSSNAHWQYVCEQPFRQFIKTVDSATQVTLNSPVGGTFLGVLQMADSELDPYGGPAWSVDTTYGNGDTVQYFGISYVSLQGSNVGNVPDAFLSPWWTVDSIVPPTAGFRTTSPVVYSASGIQDVTDPATVINPVSRVVHIKSLADVTLTTTPAINSTNLMDGAHIAVLNVGAFTITIPVGGAVRQTTVLEPGDSVTWRFVAGLFGGFFVVGSSGLTTQFIQTFDQTADVTGNQGMPLHIQVNQTVDYEGPVVFGGPTPKTYTGFAGATYDGVRGYPAVMQGPSGAIQLDGEIQWNFDAGPFGQSAALMQTSLTHTNGARTTAADVHLTNASATITSASAIFKAADNGALFTASVAGVATGTTLTFVNSTTATLSAAYTGTTSTTAVGSIWRKLNLPNASLINNSPSWVARKVQVGIANQFTVNAPNLQSGYSNPAGINGITDDQYFSGIDGGWLNASNETFTSAANGGYINTAPNISTVTDFFQPYMVGWTLTSSLSGIPGGTTIIATSGPRNAVLSANVTATQTTAVLTVTSGGTDRGSVGFWSLPVWYGKVNMAWRYDIFLSEAQLWTDGFTTATDGTTTNGSPNISSPSALWTQGHVGQLVIGAGIPLGATILSVANGHTATISANATATSSTTSFIQIGNTPLLDKHVGLYVQSMRQATVNWAACFNAPVVGYDVDTTYTSAMFKDAGAGLAGGAFISLQNSYTLDFANATQGAVLQNSGTYSFKQSTSVISTGTLAQTVATYKNARRATGANGTTTSGSPNIVCASGGFTASDVGASITGTNIPAATFIGTVTDATHASLSSSGSSNVPVNATGSASTTVFAITANININTVYGFIAQNKYQADTRLVGYATNVDFLSSPTYSVTGTGTIGGFSAHVGLLSGGVVNTGVSLLTRAAIRINDVTGTGSVGVNYGILIDPMTFGTTDNIGIQNGAKTVLGTLTVDTAGNVGGTHNLLTGDGAYNLITGTFGGFGVRYVDDTFSPAFRIGRGRTTGGFVAVGDVLGQVLFQAASSSGANTFVTGSGVRGVAAQTSSATHGGARVEILTTPINTIAAQVAAAFDNTGSFHLLPTFTSGLVTGSAFAIKNDGSLWVGPTAYTSNQPSAAGLTISTLGGVVSGSGLLSTSTSVGVGYTTGAGGTVTQATSKATGVTLNNICGQITMNGAALGATANVSFTLTNSSIAVTDAVIVNIKSGATANSYTLTVQAVAAGSCSIMLRNTSAGSLSEALVLNFAVLKAVNN